MLVFKDLDYFNLIYNVVLDFVYSEISKNDCFLIMLMNMSRIRKNLCVFGFFFCNYLYLYNFYLLSEFFYIVVI